MKRRCRRRWCPPSSSSSPTPTERCVFRCSSASPHSCLTSPRRFSTIPSSNTCATAGMRPNPARRPPRHSPCHCSGVALALLSESIGGSCPTLSIREPASRQVSVGFVDTSPVLRELTVKAMVPLAPKLLPRSMQMVMRAFAKLQVCPPLPCCFPRSRLFDHVSNSHIVCYRPFQLDEESAIRTNTTICLGKIAAHIDAATREKVCRPRPLRATRQSAGSPATES